MDNRNNRRDCRHCSGEERDEMDRRNCPCRDERPDRHRRDCDRFEDALEEAYNEGYRDGYCDGFEDGREKGQVEGYQEGYKDGYEKAKQEVLDYIRRNRCCCKCC